MNHPLRVAYIDHTSEMGGAEHLLLSLLRQLPPGEITPFLFCGQNGRLVKEVRKLGIRAEIINLPKFFSTSWVWRRRKILNPFAVIWNSISLLLAASRLTQKIRNLEIDIIQTNTILSHLYGGAAARKLNIRCIWYFHDLVEKHRLAGIIAMVWHILARSLSTHIVADSNAVLQNLSPNSSGIVIYPGVMETKRKGHKKITPLHDRLGLPVHSTLVGSLGRITFVKGLDILIDAAQMVVTKNQNVHFIIFGEALFGEEGYEKKLVEKVYQLGLSNNWHWMGYEEYVREYLEQMDFVVFPSRREAFGLSLAEAGLSGKAVIASSVGGIPEVVEEGITGILIPPENSKILALAIEEMVSNRGLATFLGGNARTRIKTNFSNSRYIDEFLKLYKTFRVSEMVNAEKVKA